MFGASRSRVACACTAWGHQCALRRPLPRGDPDDPFPALLVVRNFPPICGLPLTPGLCFFADPLESLLQRSLPSAWFDTNAPRLQRVGPHSPVTDHRLPNAPLGESVSFSVSRHPNTCARPCDASLRRVSSCVIALRRTWSLGIVHGRPGSRSAPKAGAWTILRL